MIRMSSRCCFTILLTLFATLAAEGQQAGSSGSAKPSGPSMPGQPSGSGSSQPTQQPGINQQQFQSPLYVNGRILMDNGRPVPEPVSVTLGCGMRSLQVIYTDSKGNFQFTLGSGPQGNQAMDASSEGVFSPTGNGMQSTVGGADQFAGSPNGIDRLRGARQCSRLPADEQDHRRPRGNNRSRCRDSASDARCRSGRIFDQRYFLAGA